MKNSATKRERGKKSAYRTTRINLIKNSQKKGKNISEIAWKCRVYSEVCLLAICESRQHHAIIMKIRERNMKHAYEPNERAWILQIAANLICTHLTKYMRSQLMLVFRFNCLIVKRLFSERRKDSFAQEFFLWSWKYWPGVRRNGKQKEKKGKEFSDEIQEFSNEISEFHCVVFLIFFLIGLRQCACVSVAVCTCSLNTLYVIGIVDR